MFSLQNKITLHLFCFETLTRLAWSFLLSVSLGITPGSGQGTICGSRNQTSVGYIQGKCLASCTISLALIEL